MFRILVIQSFVHFCIGSECKSHGCCDVIVVVDDVFVSVVVVIMITVAILLIPF